MLCNATEVFDRLQAANLKLKTKKCCLFANQVTYFGHVVQEQGTATDPAKIAAVRDWPVPANVTELLSFLGLCGYYQRFIKNFAKCLQA